MYLLNKNEEIITTLGVDKRPFFNDLHTEKLNSENTFEFSIPANIEHTEDVIEGNYVVFRDSDHKYQMFEIIEVEETHEDSLVKVVYCENVFTELNDDIIEDKRPNNVTAHFALTQALENTRWQVGNVDDLGLNSTNFYYDSVLGSIQKILNTWNAEVRFRVEVSANAISGRYVDIVAQRGNDTGKRIEYGKDIESIKRTVDARHVKTALYGRGKGEETEAGGYGRRITFEEINNGKKWIGNEEARQRWGRIDSNGIKRHRFGIFEDSDEEDIHILLEKTEAELEKVKEPIISYEIDAVDLEQFGLDHEKVRLGDTVIIIDREFKPELKLKARVVEIRRSLTEKESSSFILGNFLSMLTDDDRLDRLEAKFSDRSGVWDSKYTPGNPVDTSWLDGAIDVLNNRFNSSLSNWWTDDDGNIVFEAKNGNSAMQLSGDGFRIANEKHPVTDEWNWRTFGTGEGFTADEIKVGKLRSSLIQLGAASTFEDGYNPYTQFYRSASLSPHQLANMPLKYENGGFMSPQYGNYLEVDEDLHIGYTTVIASGNGSINVQLRRGHSSSGELVVERNFSLSEGENYLNLNFVLEPGDYTLQANPTVSCFRSSSGVTYPYDNGIFRFVGSSSGDSFYYYLYDLEVSGSGLRNTRLSTNRQSDGTTIPRGTYINEYGVYTGEVQAEQIKAGTITQSGLRSIVLEQGEVKSFYDDRLSMTFGQYRLNFFSRDGGDIGYFGPNNIVDNPDIQGLAMVTERDYISIGRSVSNIIRPSFRMSNYNRSTMVAGSYESSTNGSVLGLYGNSYIWGGGNDHRSTDQPCIILDQGSISNGANTVLNYFGGVHTRTQATWEVRWNSSTTTHSTRIRATNNAVEFGANVTDLWGGAIRGPEGNRYYENNTGDATLFGDRIYLVANGIRRDSSGRGFYIGTWDGGDVHITNGNGYNAGDGIVYRDVRASGFIEASSVIYKDNIERYEDNATAIIMSLNPSSYYLKEDLEHGIYDKKRLGLIAEEVPSLFRNEDAINYNSVMIALLKMNQEQQERIEELEQKVEDLELAISV
ncbi:phage tail spike protein [Evansella cellulosilytica]|uniref:Phage minor structural protein n=1 Tax=Evansella cellulosilytica (strain ATCC 21833 / DSM 2522 / FERM P-1141 / JCM 9156 / N-4) TaxID=649639 RepID=E6U1L2_EVAC2|nr:phage tail spike protein [Evansella cellulosilytica]ADU30375.1 phage minor structural protein [Evansella cellulosilytica DSM 2522]